MPNELIERGLKEIKEGEINSAIMTFRKMVKLFPKNSLGHFYLANLYSIKDEKKNSLDAFTKAWQYGNNQQKYFRNIPAHTLFVLISMDPQPKEEIREWVERAKDFYKEYTLEEKIMIDCAEKILEKN